jgi:hypothetical protein
MHAKSLLTNIFKIFIFIILFDLIFQINYIFRVPDLYGSQIFLTDIVASTSITAFLKFLLFIIGSIVIIFLSNKLAIYSKDKIKGLAEHQMLIIILFITFFIKMLILGFSIDDSYSIDEKMNSIFYNGEFNEYKLYNYLSFIIFSLTDHYHFYLTMINILFGCITIGVLYLIFKRIMSKDSSLFLLITLSILYIPTTSIETFLRVDAMYTLLLTSTFYYLLKIIECDNNKDFIKLLVILVLSCFCRESTLYMLPLFVFILFFSKSNKIKYIFGISIPVILTSVLISSYNFNNYGIKSKFKEFHLIIHAMHYGYLNDYHMNSYKDNISPKAQKLLLDLNTSYKNFIPPHKRESFNLDHFGSASLKKFWPLIRSDTENLATKSSITSYKGKLEKVINGYLNILNTQNDSISKINLLNLMSKQSLSYTNIDDQNLSEYVKTLVYEIFLAEKINGGMDDFSAQGICSIKKELYETSCVIGILKNIDHNWMTARSDFSSYYKVALPLTWRFDSESKKYIQHPEISYITEIMLELPVLYVTQSLLTLTSMSGNAPVPSGLAQASGIYKKSIMPSFFLLSFQKIYTFIINFWYFFSFLAFLYSILPSSYGSRKLNVILSLIPLYYGLFIVFAAQGEFARLMLPMVPFIIYNYLIVINNLYESGKSIIIFSQAKI